jgi:type II secretory pathway component PulF
MLFAGLFFFAAIALYVVTIWLMRRQERGQVLRLLAALLHRQMPLEASLAALGQAETGAREERLARRLSERLARGEDLPDALRHTGLVGRQQAVALKLAREGGTAAALLARMAEEATQLERRFLQTKALMLYALVMGAVLGLHISFISMFIVPKLEQMLQEMGIKGPRADLLSYSAVLVLALLAWGLLSLTLQTGWLARLLWWRVPLMGTHVRLLEQAAFARNLGRMLAAGATMEQALFEIVSAGAGGKYQRTLLATHADLLRGAAPLEAFRGHGRWRPEVLWALEAIAAGAPPGGCLEEVAQVLEDKASTRLNMLHRVFTPVAILLAAAGVGCIAWTLFSAFESIQRGLLR